MYSVGDKVVYPHHGAGKIMKIEQKEVLGQQRDYLTIQILHNDMTVMVPVENADRAGLRKVVESDVVDQVLEVLRGDPTKMPKNWSRRYKHNRDKLKTGDIFEVAEVVRNLAIRHADKGLSTGEKQMFSKAKKILASELMYARDFSEDEANAFLEEVLENINVDGASGCRRPPRAGHRHLTPAPAGPLRRAPEGRPRARCPARCSRCSAHWPATRSPIASVPPRSRRTSTRPARSSGSSRSRSSASPSATSAALLLSRLLRRGLDHVDEVMQRVSGAEVVVAIGGVVVGLFIATLISIALVRIPIVGPYLTVPIYLLAGYFTAYLAAKKHVEILRLLGVRGAFEVLPGLTPSKLLDSSASSTGASSTSPRRASSRASCSCRASSLEELQHLADSADAEKRVRGRRGLDFVRRLQNSSGAVRIDDGDYPDIDAVDAKLVRLARDLGARASSPPTTRSSKVAEIQGVKVLNVNDLANSVKPAVLPGEVIEVKILREGREQDQGVGYLDDGTMIVVESGASLVGSRVKAEVTSVLQSPSGKMIFTPGARLAPADKQGGRTWRNSRPKSSG